jgi:DNA-binding XRE family transcriptional regulator
LFPFKGIPYFSISVYDVFINLLEWTYMELECRLAEMRRRYNKISQKRLSELTGIGINKISAYENNKTIMSIPTAYTIAAALGCRVDSLYKIIK